MSEIFTIGHSNHPIDEFVHMLTKHAISLLVDVRSEPYSRYAPQFNKLELERSLERSGIDYRYSGAALGGRPKDPALQTTEGNPDYGRMAASEQFRNELDAVMALANTKRVCLMCSEADPMCCHRESVVATELRKLEVQVTHISPDGQTERTAD
jgi:uncharacterized protein (DUF488 family)